MKKINSLLIFSVVIFSITTCVLAMEEDDKKEVAIQDKEGALDKLYSLILYRNDNTVKSLAWLDEKKIPSAKKQIVINSVTWGCGEKRNALVKNHNTITDQSTTENLLEIQKTSATYYEELLEMMHGTQKHNLQLSENQYKQTYKSAIQGQKNEISYLKLAFRDALTRFRTCQELRDTIYSLSLQKERFEHEKINVDASYVIQRLTESLSLKKSDDGVDANKTTTLQTTKNARRRKK